MVPHSPARPRCQPRGGDVRRGGGINQTPMKPIPLRRAPLMMRILAVTLACSARVAFAQAAPAPQKEEPVTLAQFIITETPANPYQSRQALSASRVAMDI